VLPGRPVTWRAISGGAQALALALAAVASAGGLAHAQGKLEARYTMTISGVPIGRATWVSEIGEDQYTTAVSGRIAGILRAFTSGEGSGAARGLINAGRLVSTSYAASVVAEDKPDEIRMVLSGGNVRELTVEPPTPASPDRVALTEAHRRGVIDPLSAVLVSVPGSGDLFVPDACQRTMPIFDGRQRYDLTLTFKRVDHVKAERGYQGQVVVCMITYEPVAGHRPERSAIKHLTQTREMEIALAPIAGTRVLAPFRVSLPTLLGPAVLQAVQFATLPPGPRPTSIKTQ